jgi:tetratricopeptide (TPR) repeat protein
MLLTERQATTARASFEAGVRAHAAGRIDEAITAIDAALRIEPDFPEALSFAAFILQQQGHRVGALRFYDRALTLKPSDAPAWFNRGLLLHGAGRLDEARESFAKACALRPDAADYHCNLGATLHDLGRLAEAEDTHRRALTLDPGSATTALNLGNALMRQGRYREARDSYLRATRSRPDYALAFCGLGIVAKELGRFNEAMQAFDRALEIAPDSQEALSNRGCLQLLLGDFARGWEGYEYRWSRGQRPVPISTARFDLSTPASLAGRRILVVNDHGLGDTIQFFRYVVLLARAGAEVTFAGPRKLRRLLSSSGVEVNWRDEGDLAGSFDDRLAISSLPRAFATRLDTIPAPTPYLFAEPDDIESWRARLGGEGVKVGLCWRGNVDFRVDPRRSIPPEALLPFARLDGVRLVNLQKGACAEELPSELASRLENLSGDFDSGPDAFIDTAAIMAGLNLVVTCDTSIAHLAGALDRPVWVALRHISEWRWMVGRETSPWYPSMRLFRCREGDDWTALLSEMAKKIRPRPARG